MPARLLLRGQWRARRGRHVALGASLAVGLVAFLVLGMVAQAARDSVAQPLADLVVGDARVTLGSQELAGGTMWTDYRDTAEALVADARDPLVVAPRIEASHVTARNDRLDNWTGGILLGIDPAIAAEQAGLASHLVWGTVLPTASLSDPASGRVYVPLVVGESAARRLDLHLRPDGHANFTEVLHLTSGRFKSQDSLPLRAEAVVVGVYATGLDALDRFTALAPLGDVRLLVGGHPGDRTANALVVHGAMPDLARAPQVNGQPVQAEDPATFAHGYMGAFLAVLDAASLLALVLFVAMLGMWILHDVGTQVGRDAPMVAALRAIGVPAGTIAASYAGLAVATVGAAALAADAVAVVLALAAPTWSLRAAGLRIDVAWALRPADLVVTTLACVALAALAAGTAVLRLRSQRVADGLRPT